MLMKVLGCGNAFSNKNFNQCMLLEETEECGVRRMLLDCGYQTGAALHKAGIPLNTINDVYISHLHADHIGFLEGLGFQRYDWANRPISSKEEWKHEYAAPVKLAYSKYAPNLYGNEGLLRELWEKSLRGGMACIQGLDATLDTFFYTMPIKAGDYFEWGQWRCEPIQQIHIMAGSYITNTFGLFMSHMAHDFKVYFTTDSQHCSPNQIEIFYKRADIIIQDCECIGVDTKNRVMKFGSGVHANYAQLAGWDSANATKLSPEIKAKMYLSHYQDFVTEDKDFFGNDCNWIELAKKDGFKGFLMTGQTIDTNREWLINSAKVQSKKEIITV